MTWGPTPWTGLTPARPEATPARPDITLARNPTAGLTPAQAYGHPNFVTDVPVQGPTDEGLRAASCWWAQNRLPAQPHCVDCQGKGNVMVPGWSRSSMACPGCGMLGESISFGGARVRGYALGQVPASIPSLNAGGDVSSVLSPGQMAWVTSALTTLNAKVTATTGSSCPTWQDPTANLAAAAGCFQLWYNANYTPPKAPGAPLRTDGVLDQSTLSALQMVAGIFPADFPNAFPSAPTAPATPTTPATPSTAVTTKPGLSTGAMVGFGVAGAAVLGGIVYAATRKPAGRKSRRR